MKKQIEVLLAAYAVGVANDETNGKLEAVTEGLRIVIDWAVDNGVSEDDVSDLLGDV